MSFYALQNARTGLFWDLRCRLTPEFMAYKQSMYTPSFVELCVLVEHYEISTRFGQLETLWKKYEFQRIAYHPEWDELVIRKLKRQVTFSDDGILPSPSFTKTDAILDRIRIQRGEHFYQSLSQIVMDNPDLPLPLYVLKRKGKTVDIVDSLPNTIKRKGPYVFMWNEDDYVLTKLALSGNIITEYDMDELCSL